MAELLPTQTVKELHSRCMKPKLQSFFLLVFYHALYSRLRRLCMTRARLPFPRGFSSVDLRVGGGEGGGEGEKHKVIFVMFSDKIAGHMQTVDTFEQNKKK